MDRSIAQAGAEGLKAEAEGLKVLHLLHEVKQGHLAQQVIRGQEAVKWRLPGITPRVTLDRLDLAGETA